MFGMEKFTRKTKLSLMLSPGTISMGGRLKMNDKYEASKVKEQSKFIVIQCNECGAKSIYSAKDAEMKCKGCKSEDVKIIKNPF